MARKRNETNDQFMRRIMNFGCPTGALSHAFILTALEKYAAQCIEAGPAVFDSPFISGEGWVKTAEWIKAEVDSHLRSN